MKYLADLHIHSKESLDSSLKPLDILKTAKARGLNLIAVTDHGTIRGGVLTRQQSLENPGLNIHVIVGAEITTWAGDIIGLFLEEEIKNKDPFEVIKEIKKQGGISIYAHPFRTTPADEEVLKSVNAVEIYNCRSSERENLLAQNFAFKFAKPGLAASDAHCGEEVGKAYTVFEFPDNNTLLTASNFFDAEITPVVNA